MEDRLSTELLEHDRLNMTDNCQSNQLVSTSAILTYLTLKECRILKCNRQRCDSNSENKSLRYLYCNLYRYLYCKNQKQNNI